MTFRVSLLTIESDSPDPAIMVAIRELLERAGVNGAVVVSQPDAASAPVDKAATPAPSSKHTSIARHLMDGSLQELIMAAVTARPGTTDQELAAAILNDTTPSAVTRIRLAASPLVLTGRLVRADKGKLYTPAAAATLPAFQGAPKRKERTPKAPPPVVDREPCRSFPPCAACRKNSGPCVSLVKPAAPVIDGEFPEVNEEPAVPAPALTTERPLRVHVPEGQPVPPSDPTGRVDGYPAPPPVAGSLQERIRDAVNAAPGVTIDNLAIALLGNGSRESKRKIDFQAGSLVMSGELMRLNGGLYPKGYRGPAVKATPATNARPAAATSNERYYQQILAAYARDNNTPQRELADKLFGASVGHTVAKLQLMLRQLVATERLERRGQGTYRPVDEKERRGRADDDEQDEDEDEDTESNGVSDDVEELDVE